MGWRAWFDSGRRFDSVAHTTAQLPLTGCQIIMQWSGSRREIFHGMDWYSAEGEVFATAMTRGELSPAARRIEGSEIPALEFDALLADAYASTEPRP